MKDKIETQPCPYTDSVLFQFILIEFLRAHKELNTLENLYNEQTRISSDGSLQSLLQAAKIFTGCTPIPGKVQFWQQELGTMAKLRKYSFYFQQESQQKELLNLKNLARKGWLLSIELSDVAENSLGLKHFGRSLAKVIKTVHSLQQPVMKLITQFSDDENVVLFLVSHQRPLDSIFGEAFTIKQLQAMHNSIHESAQFLIKSFSMRRFDQLLPIISQKFAALESAP